jgi:hypothetical protein
MQPEKHYAAHEKNNIFKTFSSPPGCNAQLKIQMVPLADMCILNFLIDAGFP